MAGKIRRPMAKGTGNQAEKLARTRHAVLALLRKYPGLSRQDCARRLELSAFTVSHVVADLIREGMLLERESAPGAGPQGAGRPGTPLALRGEHGYVAGIDIEASAWRFVVVDFAGAERFRMVKPLAVRRTARQYTDDLMNVFAGARQACGPLWNRVMGLGVAAPGLLDAERGVVESYAPLPGFRQMPLHAMYAGASGIPTFLLHNVVSLAACDLWLRAGSEDEATFHAVVRSGIAGVLSERRRVFPGSHGLAGELGHWRVNLGAASSPRLQDIAGLTALRECLQDVEPGFWNGEEAAVTWALKRAAVRGPLERAMSALGQALAGVGALIDPDRIVVHSPLFTESNALWPLLHDSFFAEISPTFARRVELDRSEQPETAAALGAALFALQNLYPASPDPLSVPW